MQIGTPVGTELLHPALGQPRRSPAFYKQSHMLVPTSSRTAPITLSLIAPSLLSSHLPKHSETYRLVSVSSQLWRSSSFTCPKSVEESVKKNSCEITYRYISLRKLFFPVDQYILSILFLFLSTEEVRQQNCDARKSPC